MPSGGPPPLPSARITEPIADVDDDKIIPNGLGKVKDMRRILQPVIELIRARCSVGATGDALLGLIYTRAFGRHVSYEEACSKIHQTISFIMTKGARQKGSGVYAELDETHVLEINSHCAKACHYMAKKVSSESLKRAIKERIPPMITENKNDSEWDIPQIGSGLPQQEAEYYANEAAKAGPVPTTMGIVAPDPNTDRSKGGFIHEDFLYYVPHSKQGDFVTTVWTRLKGPKPRKTIEGTMEAPTYWESMLCETLSAMTAIGDPLKDLDSLTNERLDVGQMAAKLQTMITESSATGILEPALALTGYVCSQRDDAAAQAALRQTGCSIDSEWKVWPQEVAPMFASPTEEIIRQQIGGLFVGDSWFFRTSPGGSAGQQVNKDFGRSVPHTKTIFVNHTSSEKEGLTAITDVIMKYVRLNQEHLMCNPDTGRCQFGTSRPLILASSSYCFWWGKDSTMVRQVIHKEWQEFEEALSYFSKIVALRLPSRDFVTQSADFWKEYGELRRLWESTLHNAKAMILEGHGLWAHLYPLCQYKRVATRIAGRLESTDRKTEDSSRLPGCGRLSSSTPRGSCWRRQ